MSEIITRVRELTLYKDFSEFTDLFHDMTWLMENYDCDNHLPEGVKGVMYENINRLVAAAEHYGLEGNLWHSFLTFLLVNNENPFTLACERIEKTEGTVTQLALNDFEIFRNLFQADLSRIETFVGVNGFSLIQDFKTSGSKGKIYDERLRSRIYGLSLSLGSADNGQQFLEILTDFYKEFGVGKMGLHKAFRVYREEGQIEINPVTNVESVSLKDLVGYELQKKKLIDNTEAFVEGRKANNCLLYGDSGTGKSTSIKAILNQYYDQGLRMIEVYKHQTKELSSVIERVKDRNYKFIIYMDDLSFEDFEIEYKYLKAVIEGGLEKKPDNVLIYATSNRRHLIREKWSDKEERREDLHASDTVQEKLSLASRFGVTIFFGSPGKKDYLNIVKVLSEKYHIEMPEEELYFEANKWEMSHGGLSGRTAQQFINYLVGKQK